MKIYEIDFLLDNIEYATRNEWEMLRTHAYLCMVPHCKRLEKNKILQFPWDKENIEHAVVSENEKNRLREQAKFIEQKIAQENKHE